MKRIIYDLSECLKFIGNKKITYLFSMVSCNIIGSFCYNIVLAIIMQKVLDSLAYKNRFLFYEAFLWAGISFIFAIALEPVLSKVKYQCVSSVIQHIRESFVENVSFYQVREYEKMETADIILRATQDVERIEQIYLSYIPNLIFAIIHGGTACAIMLWYNVWLGLFSLIIGIVHTKINFCIVKKVEEFAKERQKMSSFVLKSVTELLDGKTDIIMAHAQKFFFHMFVEQNDNLYKKERATENEIKKTEDAENFFGQFNNILIMLLGLFFVLKGNITVGTIAAIISLQGNATYLFQNISGFATGFADAMPSLERVIEVIEAIAEKESAEIMIEDEDGDKECSDYVPALKLTNLSFGYPDGRELLHNISLDIPQGKFVVIMGESGKGKSTLGKILLRFYLQTNGDYYVYGKKMTKRNIQFARKHIAYLDQNSFIFSLSIFDNLQLVREDATREEITEACKTAEAHDFIMELPDNYNYVISQGHDNISGGQRQRLAMARMILSDRPIFLIDEGTASLDADTEKKIVEKLAGFRGKKTILFITHHEFIQEYADLVFRL